jgi:hypothetical protein
VGFGKYNGPVRLDITSDAPFGCGQPGQAGRTGLGAKCALFLGRHGGKTPAMTGEGTDAGETLMQLCPRRIPTYADYVIEGNLVILCEPKAADNPRECAAVAQKLRAG